MERLGNGRKFRNGIIVSRSVSRIGDGGLPEGVYLALVSILFLVIMIGAGLLIMILCFYFISLLRNAVPLSDPFAGNKSDQDYEHVVVTPKAEEQENEE